MDQKKYIFKVSELNSILKELLETDFPDIWLEGEISNYRPNSSGHHYFTLKDEGGQIGAVMFRTSAGDLKFKLEDGLKVIVRGRVSIYIPGGRYQIIVSAMEPAGMGSLALAFEQLKLRLEKEGLFDPARKKTIPLLPQKIGIVTSPTGAAIRDMLKILDNRFGNLEILIYPVLVQGEGAKEQISQAIYDLNEHYPALDVIIVGRGGGSIEDLWAFNEEIVARAIYASSIPVISAVGHEYDFTIADFVADLRAATPSNAAELVVKEKQILVERVINAKQKMAACLKHKFENYRLRLTHAVGSSVLVRPLERLQEMQQRIDEMLERIAMKSGHIFEIYRNRFKEIEDRLMIRFEHYFENKKSKFSYAAGQLNALSPLGILERGYSIVYAQPTNKIINSAEQLKLNDQLKIKLFKGEVLSTVKEVNPATLLRKEKLEGKWQK